MTLRVLALTRYANLGASSRVRFAQYLPALAEQGISVELHPLLPDKYVHDLYNGKRSLHTVSSAYAKRLIDLCRLNIEAYDLYWIEKELLPWIPASIESWLSKRLKPYILDIDDAIFHQYESHRNPVVRALLRNKIERCMEAAALVTAGSSFLAERARRAGAGWVELLPSSVDCSAPTLLQSARTPPVIGWIGSPATARYLQLIEKPMRSLVSGGHARFRCIGLSLPPYPGLEVELREWSSTTERKELDELDIGIMPLEDGVWEQGKCAYKLIQYFAAGKPVVASSVGENIHVVTPGSDGFLVTNESEWIAALQTLLADPELRHRMGLAGRQKCAQRYSLDVTAARLAGYMTSIHSAHVGGSSRCAE